MLTKWQKNAVWYFSMMWYPIIGGDVFCNLLKRSRNVCRQRYMYSASKVLLDVNDLVWWMVWYRSCELSEPCLNRDRMNQHIMCTLCKCLLVWLMEVKPVHDCPLLFQGLTLREGLLIRVLESTSSLTSVFITKRSVKHFRVGLCCIC